jgi:hypothetical protein
MFQVPYKNCNDYRAVAVVCLFKIKISYIFIYVMSISDQSIAKAISSYITRVPFIIPIIKDFGTRRDLVSK